ncbi:MAG: type II/IV secretion system ATPase subunit [Candidatus Methanomethylophilaceae archaeon]|nr:type II/IV secretion system ATPase subunit [Candidatus Methanomethylophilaceae archaeon]
MIGRIRSGGLIIRPEPEDRPRPRRASCRSPAPEPPPGPGPVSIDVRRARPSRVGVPRKFGPLLSSSIADDIRRRPSYADTWMLPPTPGTESIASYESDGWSASVGTAPDGEYEYTLIPLEYSLPDAANRLVSEAVEAVRRRYMDEGGPTDRDSVRAAARSFLWGRMDELEDALGDGAAAKVDAICGAVHRHAFGAGILESVLSDPHIEDVYIDAPCWENRIYVTMNGIEGVNSHMRCRTNLLAGPGEVSNLINILKRESGLRYCQSSPVLETDLPGFDARATIVGYPMSPNGDAVAIRKRSDRPWTLPRLIMNGTMDAGTAGLLSFMVDNRCTMLVCGARGSGKSSLLSALMFEHSPKNRIITIEDTIELPGETMRKLGYKVQTILVDDRMNGDQLSRSNEALRLSLRLGESAIVLGEVRGEEARTLYQSMRTGRAGSSIMGTVHGDSARTVYDRMVHDLGISAESFMATDVIVTLGTRKDRTTGNLVRRVEEVASTTSRPGEFSDITEPSRMLSSNVIRRAMTSGSMAESDVSAEIAARGTMRSMLADGGRKDERYLRPEWVMAANEELSKGVRGSPERLRARMREGAMP